MAKEIIVKVEQIYKFGDEEEANFYLQRLNSDIAPSSIGEFNHFCEVIFGHYPTCIESNASLKGCIFTKEESA